MNGQKKEKFCKIRTSKEVQDILQGADIVQFVRSVI